MPSEADTTDATDDVEVAPRDEAREALLDALTAELGDTIVGSHLLPGKDLWIRIDADAWGTTASYLRNRQQFRFFNWLSAIDWMPSPFGRSLDAAVDLQLGTGDTDEAEVADSAGSGAMTSGYAGGETRFQVLARVHSLTTGIGLTVKADLLDEAAPSVATWTHEYPGATWHEREAWEMFGISFVGHPGLRPLYLPGDFEGYPLRKDYPLLARLVKPWPGIVDVEPMPSADNDGSPSVENTEAAGTVVDSAPDTGSPSTEEPS